MSSQSAVTNHLSEKSIEGYQIERLLGQSTISAVYLARSHKHDQAVLFTTFTLSDRFALPARERFNNRFLRSVSALACLRHPHILPILDGGMSADILYMVTPLAPVSTLATLLQRQPRLSVSQVVEMTRQIVDGMEYAHRAGVVHGSLNSGSILLEGERHVQISGFGLVQLLALSGIESFQHSYAHLLSVGMTFLGDPLSIAPEVVQGMPVTTGADIYALGVLLFELFCGRPPFTGADPLKTAQARLQMPVPSLRELRPDLPSALDLVVQRAMEPDPMRRYLSAGSLFKALEQALREGETAKQVAVTTRQGAVFPPVDDISSNDRTWESAETHDAHKERDSHQQETQEIHHQKTSPLSVVAALSTPPQAMSTESVDSPEEGAIDPFARWSPAALSASERAAFTWAGRDAASPLPTTTMLAPTRLAVSKKRRRLVAALVTGGVVLGGLGTGGVALAHLLQGSPGAQGSTKKTAARVASQPTPLSRTTAKPSPTATAKPSPTATARPSPTPTAQPSPTPGHTGTVIGSTRQGSNTSKTFTNPADGNNSLLIHLSNGNFVAFETACPHEGATCYYNAGTQKIVCPRHDALFDPTNNAAVLQGPPKRPLTAVPIKVNADGTVTAG